VSQRKLVNSARAAKRLAGAQGKFFFRGPQKYFPGKFFVGFQKFFPKKFPVDNFLGKRFFRTSTLQFFPAPLSQFFIPHLGILPKKSNILPFAQKYLTQKNYCGPTKIFWGPGAICPPCPPLGSPKLGQLTKSAHAILAQLLNC
jgi:hypothetical protein